MLSLRSRVTVLKILFNVCVYVCTHVRVLYVYHVYAGTRRGQKVALETLDLELQVVVRHHEWVLETKSRSSARALSGPNYLSRLFSPKFHRCYIKHGTPVLDSHKSILCCVECV